MVRKIGYLAPEFPGQTHQFLWREIKALAELGLPSTLISTRRPAAGIVVHAWAKQAVAETTYLFPMDAADAADAAAELLRAGPVRVAKCLAIAAGASDMTPRARARLAALVIPAAKLAAVARKEGLTHLHVASCADAANVAMFASLLSGLPYSLSLLGPTLEGYGPNQTNKWRHAAFVVVMSKLLYDHSRKVLAGFLPPIVEIAPVGVDLEVMKRAGQYTPWVPGQVARIYACGRLNPVKAHPDLVDAVGVLRERGIDAQLIIAGEDEKGGHGYRKDVEQHIERRNASSYVTLLGAVSEDKHKECLQNAHIFALTSLNEGISVAIMEAMAMQTPVVATAVGGNAELIETGVNGLLAKAQDPKSFADDLEKVLRDSAFTLALTERSRQTVAEKFDSRAAARIIAKCLERVEAAKAAQPVHGATPA